MAARLARLDRELNPTQRDQIITASGGGKSRKPRSSSIPASRTIQHRPTEVEDRKTFGHWEADLLSAKNKDFIFDLFPSGKIYTTFLPAEARNAIGKVGKETEPVVHMLKKIGFEYRNQVDPFDGGPHLWAETDHLVPIRKSRTLRWTEGPLDSDHVQAGLLTKAGERPEFRAFAVEAQVAGDELSVKNRSAEELRAITKMLEIAPGDSVLFMPYY